MPGAARPRRVPWWGWLGLICVGCAVCLGALGVAWPTLLANHARYLTQAGRYAEAMQAWLALEQRFPAKGARAGVDGIEPKAWTLQQAIAHWQAIPPVPGQPDFNRVLTFFELAEAQPTLGRAARQGALAILTSCDPLPTSATMSVARRILKNDGYDADALWWLAQLQYDPARPFVIAPEASQFREPLAAALIAAQSGAPAAPFVLGRLELLNGLNSLDQKDWGAAAAQLAEFERAAPALPPSSTHLASDLLLAEGVALLRGGRPGEALTPLQQYQMRHTADAEAYAALFEAYWTLRQIPWAATTAAALQQASPARMQTEWGELSRSVERSRSRQLGVTPEAVALAQLAILTGLPPLPGCAWSDVRHELSRTPLSLRQRLDAIETMLWQGDAAGARELATGLGVAGAVSDSLETALLHAVEGWEQSGKQGGASHPLGEKELNQLLTRAATAHFDVTIPPGSQVALILVKGYQVGEVWPLLNVRLGGAVGSWYLAGSRAAPRPILLPLSAGQAGADLGVSLLNPSADGSRAVLLQGIYFF